MMKISLEKQQETFVISETSVRRYLKSCEEERIISVDPTKYCRYILSTVEKTGTLKNDGSLEEDRIFFSKCASFCWKIFRKMF